MKDDAVIQAAVDAAPVDQPEERKRRHLLMAIAPVILLMVAIAYLFSGRYVSTDNAFVRADIANLSPEVSGTIQQVMVQDNQAVKAGQPLIKIDSTNYEILLAASDTQLKRTASEIDAERAKHHENVEELRIARTTFEFAGRQLQRQSKLSAAQAGSEATRDAAQNGLDIAKSKVAVAEEKVKESLAKLFGNPDIAVADHPSYQQMVAQREVTALQVKRSTLIAPFDGVVSHMPKVGDYARTGVMVASLVSTTKVWVEANFKETEITYMRKGQDVEMTVDAYPGHVWQGKVASLAQATGSEFSLLPAQNATGNWVKVVQRLPVNVFLDDANSGPTLRAGMSVDVNVDSGTRRIARWLSATE